jgi:hypothetical protein
MREITEEQFRLLEQHHGEGMVVVLGVGAEQFAFRRLSSLDVDLVQLAMEEKQFGCHEQAAVRCILTPEVPTENRAQTDKDEKRKTKAHPALVAERERLSETWRGAQAVRDMVGLELAKECGWQWAVKSEALGGGLHRITCQRTKEDGKTPVFDLSETDGAALPEDFEAPIELEARAFEPIEYGEWRRKMALGDPGAAERYAYKLLIKSQNKDEVARLYPYLVLIVGQALGALGAEGKAVSVKKFKRAGSQQPANSSTKQPEEISP